MEQPNDTKLTVGSYVPKDVSKYSYPDMYGRHKPPSERYLERKARAKASQAKKAEIKAAMNKGHKLCTKCNEELPLSSFQVDKTTFTGYSSWCKSCKKDYNQRYRKNYSDNNVEDTDND